MVTKWTTSSRLDDERLSFVTRSTSDLPDILRRHLISAGADVYEFTLERPSLTDTVAEIIVQAKGRPISIGISGAWGVGKSSMIKLVRHSLEHRSGKEKKEKEESKFVFVEFNAWLYQGYDDVRAALMDVIGEKLTREAEHRKKGIEKAKEFVERIRWFRLAKLIASSAVAMHAGMPPVGLIGEIYGLGKAFLGGDVSAESAEKAVEIAGEVKKTATGLLDPKIEPVTEKVIHGPISFNLSYCRPILIVQVVIYAEGSDTLDHAQLFKHLQRQILRKIRRKTSSVGSFVGMLFRNRA